MTMANIQHKYLYRRWRALLVLPFNTYKFKLSNKPNKLKQPGVIVILHNTARSGFLWINTCCYDLFKRLVKKSCNAV